MTGNAAAAAGQPERDKRKRISPTDQAHRELARDHPLEEAQKSYHTMLEQQLSQSEEELERPASALLLSGLTAGLDLGFGPFAMAVLLTLTRDTLARPLQEMLEANLYALGFIFVVLGRSALFTEHTTSAMQPVLARRASVAQLGRLWGLVLAANVAGGALFAWFASVLGPGLGAADAAAFGEIAGRVVRAPSAVMLLSAVGAGWLMGLLSWLAAGSRDTISQIVVVWLTTMLIGLAGLHHSVAGTVEVLMGVFVGQGATLAEYGRFLWWAALGNAVGGAFFVAVLKFSHVRQSVE